MARHQGFPESGVEAISVCTPNVHHAAPTIAALRAGAHVLVEKPIAASVAEGEAMIRAARLCGLIALAVLHAPSVYAQQRLPVRRDNNGQWLKDPGQEHLGKQVTMTDEMKEVKDKSIRKLNR